MKPRRHVPIWARKTFVILALSLAVVWFINGLLDYQPVAWLILGAVFMPTIIQPMWRWWYTPSRHEA